MDGDVKVQGLWKSFGGSDFLRPWGHRIPALEGLTLHLGKGELAALVGESGSGKTTLGRCLLGLVPFDSGDVEVNGFTVGRMSRQEERAFRMSAQMVFQNPYSSLNPAFRAKESLIEAVRVHDRSMTRAMALDAIAHLADLVQLPLDRLEEFPPSLSGGEKRRLVFARALATKPKFIVTDEPVSGLDQPIQAQLLDLLRGIQRRQDSTMLFISHDLRLVRYVATRVIVLHRGRILEDAPAEIFFQRPSHPYSQELLESAFYPLETQVSKARSGPPDRGAAGCSFRNRCPYAELGEKGRCGSVTPELLDVGGGHRVACHLRGRESG